MLDGIFKIDLKDKLKISITNNEIYNQFILYLYSKVDNGIVLVTPTLTEANNLYSRLSYYLKDDVFIFPDDDYLTKKAIVSSPEFMYMRLKFLNNFNSKSNKILICHTNSYLKKLLPKNELTNVTLNITLKSKIDREILINKLNKAGYRRESIVTNTGEFSVRGFVVDVFPIFEEHPYRIEFFDEDVDKVKIFDENTHKSIKSVDEVIIKPVIDEYDNANSSVLDYFDNPLVIYHDYDSIIKVFNSIKEQLNYYGDVDVLFNLDDLKSEHSIFFDTTNNLDYDYSITAEAITSYNNDFNKFNSDLLRDNTFLCSTDNIFISKLNAPKEKIIKKDLLNGFIYNNITYLSKNDLNLNVQKIRYDTGYKMGKKINSIDKLEIGDYVVHKANGIGVYMGIQTIMKNGLLKDYILLQYKGNDKLYIPVDDVDKLYKYSSKDGAKPIIHKLNSLEWEKTKLKIKKRIKDISSELIKIYKNRNMSTTEPFLSDTPEQEIFENEFIYDETADQLKTSLEIKKDLESTKPMDRLLCGDVGYGKTEVIFRAMFKAISNNKQVMYLCPTTLLSYQQYMSALNRFKNHAVNFALLNRYTSLKETKEILEKLKEGKIDAVFGTHRLLSKDVEFKDLGLLVIDEEQRFGVMHKEKIKEIKSNVHVLSVSATPIPRSLQMSLIGVRDLSLIETPPKNKFPVQTYVINYDPYILRDVVLKEKAREGQVFILYNKVEDMPKYVEKLSNLLPEVSIRYAHGKMNRDEMQDIVYDFALGKFDVLVSTTIIENGIDIPNANTMIVIDADRFGLSQLYQIRGRVGRGSRQAYAYLMYDKNKILGETAHKRLEAIKEFTLLGSGYKIAMRDLSIRGAGDLLGSEQAGFIDSVGAEMYIELINEELNNVPEEKEEESVNISDVSNHISENYSDEDAVIIELHKLISTINSSKEFDEVYETIQDRFGFVTDDLRNYMKQELCEKLIQKLNLKILINDKNKISIKLDENFYQGINIEKLFIVSTGISTRFNFSYNGSAIIISLNKINLERHYINYILDLLLYLDNQKK